MHPLRVSIPSFRSENNSIERGYTLCVVTERMRLQIQVAKMSISGTSHQEETRRGYVSQLDREHLRILPCEQEDAARVRETWVFRVFKIDVLMNGRLHSVEKRYSEFHALHKMLKKNIKPPEIPSKHVRNWVPKVLEQRRHGLELYLQTIIMENEVLPKIFLDFLNIRHFRSVPKTESCGSFDTESMESSKLSHQPVMLFLRDPFLMPSPDGTLSNAVIEGVVSGVFYSDPQPS